MEKKRGFSYRCYRIIRWFVWLFYPRTKVVGAENLPERDAIVVGNHAQMNGPITAELYLCRLLERQAQIHPVVLPGIVLCHRAALRLCIQQRPDHSGVP